MSNIELTVDIGIDCTCGKQLEATAKGSSSNPFFEVTPCPDCLEEARKKAYDDGYDAGNEG